MTRLDLWSAREDYLLRLLYPDKPKEYLLDKLPKRTWEGIRKRAKILEIKRESTLRRPRTPKIQIECPKRELVEDDYNLAGIKRNLYRCPKEKILIGEKAKMCMYCDWNEKRIKED